MSKKVLKLAGKRPMLLAAIIMATFTLGLLFSGWLTPSHLRASGATYSDPTSPPNNENTNCDNPTNYVSCGGDAKLVFTNILMGPAASNGAPYDSIVSVGGFISATLISGTAPSTNITITCHTCDGSTPSNYCDAPITNLGVYPFNITNQWTWTGDFNGHCNVKYAYTNGISVTNGLTPSFTFSGTNATSGNVTFANLSAMMPTNPTICNVTTPGSISKTYAFVEVADLYALGYTPIADYGTNKVYAVCVVPTNAPVTNITVKASPNPWMDAQWLPGDWILSGGQVTDKETSLVSITSPGSNVVTCASGVSHKTVTILVQQVGLAPATTNVMVNNGDADQDGIPDMNDPLTGAGSYVTNEASLVQLTLTQQYLSPEQAVYLSVAAGGGKIRVWNSPNRGPGAPVLDSSGPGPLVTSWPASSMPTNLWVEGVSQSASLNDVTLTLSIGLGVNSCPVTTNLTVFSAQLGVDTSRSGSPSYGTTSATNPFCFWLNDNHDGYGIIGLHSVQEDLGGNADQSSTTISCTRDLEDYSVLGIQIQGPSQIQQMLTNGDIVVKLESAGPQIRLFPQAGSGLGYLNVSTIAQQQISAPYNAALPPIGSALPASLWANSMTNNLLFDGIGAGNDKVKVVLYSRGGTTKIGEGQPIWLNLQTVNAMYDTWTVSGSPPSSTATGSSVYNSSSPETGQYVLFVHGMGMSADDKIAFANTAYKRLWWQNYKGRFGAFDWPCLGISSYDASELIAWQSATALANKLTDLNAAYPNNVYLFAHSQGNVIAGEALEINNGTADGVQAYVACQAAISAHAYNPGTANWTPHIGTYNTPDDFANYWTPGAACYFNGVTSGGSEANFFNVNDFALRWWVRKQRLKPDTLSGYSYSGTSYYSGFGFTTLSYPIDRYTIFAYCVQSHSLAMGATANVFASSLDLQGVWGTDPFETNPNKMFSARCWHSSEFFFSTVEQGGWWTDLKDSLHLH